MQFTSLLTVSLGGMGVIDNVINNTGGPAEGADTIPVSLVSFPQCQSVETLGLAVKPASTPVSLPPQRSRHVCSTAFHRH
jgi:hypothetical protein